MPEAMLWRIRIPFCPQVFRMQSSFGQYFYVYSREKNVNEKNVGFEYSMLDYNIHFSEVAKNSDSKYDDHIRR